jgi:hypothetical protein
LPGSTQKGLNISTFWPPSTKKDAQHFHILAPRAKRTLNISTLLRAPPPSKKGLNISTFWPPRAKQRAQHFDILAPSSKKDAQHFNIVEGRIFRWNRPNVDMCTSNYFVCVLKNHDWPPAVAADCYDFRGYVKFDIPPKNRNLK